MPAAPSPSLRRRRKRLRRPGFDYNAPGAYFVTIMTWRSARVLGEILRGRMLLSPVGTIVQQVWHSIPAHRTGVRLDAFVVMPHHIHGIIVIDEGCFTLGEIVNLFKAATTRAVNRERGTPGFLFWQRGFHDRIIRDDVAWVRIARYIDDNPRRWRKGPSS